MGTLGKAFGTFGAFVAGSDELIETLIQRARPISTPRRRPRRWPRRPAKACASSSSRRLAARQTGGARAAFSHWRRSARAAVDADSPTPIQPVVAGSAERALAWSRALEVLGILVTAIRPPTVPEGSARLRITLIGGARRNTGGPPARCLVRTAGTGGFTLKLHVETSGYGPDVVLIHGWGMNAGVWAPLAASLEERYRTHRVELPGHGRSDYAKEASSLAAWAAAVCHAVEPLVTGDVTWIGWSLGAQVAVRAALDAPEAVARLVLVAGTPRFVRANDWPHAMAAATFEQFAASLAADPAATLERFLALQVRGDEQAGDTLRWLRREVRERPRPRDAALNDGLRLLLETDLRPELRRLRQPSLWLLGERDTLVPADMGHELEALHPEADVLVIRGAAHAPFLSHPVRSISLMTPFLEETGAHG